MKEDIFLNIYFKYLYALFFCIMIRIYVTMCLTNKDGKNFKNTICLYFQINKGSIVMKSCMPFEEKMLEGFQWILNCSLWSSADIHKLSDILVKLDVKSFFLITVHYFDVVTRFIKFVMVLSLKLEKFWTVHYAVFDFVWFLYDTRVKKCLV